jgi:Bacterial transcriptional activator domain
MATATQNTGSSSRPRSSHGVLVDPSWLASHLYDADLRVVEFDVSPAAYGKWHIDGAVLWNVYSDLKDANYRTVDAAAFGQQALAAQDNLAEAVGVYGQLSERLRDQLGVSPSPATRQLYQQLLAAS